MNRRRNLFASRIFGVLCLVAVASASGQTIERDTTITGPRGRSIQRQVEVQRGPGTIDRSIQIKRPGGTFDRSVQVRRSVVGGPWRGPGFVPGPIARPWMFGPRPLIVQSAARFWNWCGGPPSPVHEFLVRRWRDGIWRRRRRWRWNGNGRRPGSRWTTAGFAPAAARPRCPDDPAIAKFLSQQPQGSRLRMGQLQDPRAVPRWSTLSNMIHGRT